MISLTKTLPWKNKKALPCRRGFSVHNITLYQREKSFMTVHEPKKVRFAIKSSSGTHKNT
jgi:hypothetical protein